MQHIQTPYIPNSLTTVERRFIFDFFTLNSALMSAPDTNLFSKQYTESEANYKAPVYSHRITTTPTDGTRIIISASLRIDPMYGFNANGIWNHVLDTSPDLILP